MQLMTRGADGSVHNRKDSRGVEVKVLDNDLGIVEAVVSVTNVLDDVNDVIQSGAYSDTLQKRIPKGVWSHDWDTPVARTLNAEELKPGDPRLPAKIQLLGGGGLFVTMQFNLRTQRGKDAFEDVKFFGDTSEWSIGYVVPDDGFTIDPKTGTRYISKIDLFEYSPVLFGAMPHTATMSIKGVYDKLSSELQHAGVSDVPALKQLLDEIEAKKGLYDLRKRNDQWCVFNVNTNDDVPGGCHPTRSEALDHMRALYVNVPDARTGGKDVFTQSPTPSPYFPFGFAPIGETDDAGGVEEKPYAIRRQNGKYCVYNQQTGDTVNGGCHGTQEEATQHMRALYANVGDADKTACACSTKDAYSGGANDLAGSSGSIDAQPSPQVDPDPGKDLDDQITAPHTFYGTFADPTVCRICRSTMNNPSHITQPVSPSGDRQGLKAAGLLDPECSDTDPGSVSPPHEYAPSGGPNHTAVPHQPCLVCGLGPDDKVHDMEVEASVSLMGTPRDLGDPNDVPGAGPVDPSWRNNQREDPHEVVNNEKSKLCPRTWTIRMGGKVSKPAPCQLLKGHEGVCGPAVEDDEGKATPPLMPELHEFQQSDSGPMCAYCGQAANHMYHQGWRDNAPTNPNAVPNPGGDSWGGKNASFTVTATNGMNLGVPVTTWVIGGPTTYNTGGITTMTTTVTGAEPEAPKTAEEAVAPVVETEDKGAVGSHSTATTDVAWDAGTNVKRLGDEVGIAKGNRMFAWRDGKGDPDTKSSWKFPHHMVGSNGSPGAANTRACSAGVAALNGGRGGADIPSGDRQGVFNHLIKHLKDSGQEDLPELKDLSEIVEELEHPHEEEVELEVEPSDEEKAKKHPFLPKKGDPSVCAICGGKKDDPIHDMGKSARAMRYQRSHAMEVLETIKQMVAPDVAAAIAMLDELVDDLMDKLGIEDDDEDDGDKAAGAVETKIDVAIPGSYEQILSQVRSYLQANPPAPMKDGAQTVTWIEATFPDSVLIGCADIMLAQGEANDIEWTKSDMGGYTDASKDAVVADWPSAPADYFAGGGFDPKAGIHVVGQRYLSYPYTMTDGIVGMMPANEVGVSAVLSPKNAEAVSEKTIEAIEQKIGRTLSSSNAEAIRSAVLSLIDLLAKAGIDVDGAGKDADEDEDKVTDTGEQKTAVLSAAEIMRFKMFQLGLDQK